MGKLQLGDIENVTELSILLENVLFCNYCGLSGQTKFGSVYSIYNLTLIGALLPAMALFGACCNALSLVVFCQPHMRRRSGNVYLGALAISDFFLVTTSIYLFTFEALRQTVPVIQTCYLLGIQAFYPLGTIAQTTSVYITVMAGIDGFVATCIKNRPIKQCYTRPKTAVWMCLGVLGFSIGYNMPHFFEVDVVKCYDLSSKKYKWEPCATDLRQDETYSIVYYMYMYTVIMVVGPLAVLIILSCFIITATIVKRRRLARGLSLYKVVATVRRRENEACTSANGEGSSHWHKVAEHVRNWQSGGPGHLDGFAVKTANKAVNKSPKPTDSCAPDRSRNGKAECPRRPTLQSDSAPKHHASNTAPPQEDGDDDPITLIMVVVLFILCNALGLVVNFLEAFLASLRKGNTLNFLVDGSNFLVVFNSSVNFLIYIRFDPKFRQALNSRVLPRMAACFCGRLPDKSRTPASPSHETRRSGAVRSDSQHPLAENNPKIAEKLSKHDAKIPGYTAWSPMLTPRHAATRFKSPDEELTRDGPLSSLL